MTGGEVNQYSEHSDVFSHMEDVPPRSDGLKVRFSVDLEPLIEDAEKHGGRNMFTKIMAWFSEMFNFVVSHHETVDHTLELAETIATPFIKSDKAKDALALAEGIAAHAQAALDKAAADQAASGSQAQQ